MHLFLSFLHSFPPASFRSNMVTSDSDGMNMPGYRAAANGSWGVTKPAGTGEAIGPKSAVAQHLSISRWSFRAVDLVNSFPHIGQANTGAQRFCSRRCRR